MTHNDNNTNKFETRAKIHGKNVDILFDTGSELTMMSYECYVKLGSPKLSFNNASLKGICNESLFPLGFFHSEISFNNCDVETDIYVLKTLCYEAIIGVDVINKLNISLNENGVEILGKRKNNYYVSYARLVFENSCDKKIKTPEPSCNKDFGNTASFRETDSSQTEQQHKPPEADNVDNVNSFLSCLANAITVEEIEVSHITNKQYSQELLHIIENYKPQKVLSTDVKMKIILTDEVPIYQRSRRLPFTEQVIVEKQIAEWLEKGVIKPSSSDFAAPIVLCKKKDGEYRLCVDFRKLNKKIIKDRFPLPLIEDVLDRLEESEVFTSLDLKNGFFHVDIEEDSTKYTSFVTHNGQYEFLKVAFGLTNSPSVFLRYISHVFKDLLKDGTLVTYMDDIIIPSKDEAEGIQKLKRVLETASRFGLELNLKKCQFLKRRIEFLGYVIERGTIKPSPTKILAVQNFPRPKDIKQVQSFLGLTGYFRKFIKDYAKIAKPLSDLLRDNKEFCFGLEQEQAFESLKKVLTSDPVLHIFKQGAKLELHTDASSHGFGAILLQEGRDNRMYPIHYMSKKTNAQQEKYSSYELEVLAVIEALKKFRNYLLGSKFKIVTDCSAFQKTMSKKDLTPKIARWALSLEEFDYEIVHRPATMMKHVDALSRNILVVTKSQDEMTTKIISAQDDDEHIKLIKTLVEKGEENHYFVKNCVLYKYEKGRELLVIPQAMQAEIIRKIHSEGHFAAAKTEEILKRDFYIPKTRKEVDRVIANCVNCILYNKKRGKGEGMLNPIPKEDSPLSTYHIDFIGPLPSTNKNYQHIFTVVDAFTKFVWFYPVKSTSAQDAIDKLKLQQNIFGNPSRIISDRGSAFTSKNFEDYCTGEGIEHFKITAGIPRGNGQIERIHSILIPVLAKLSSEDPNKWYKHVAGVQRIINSTNTRSTKYSPFELMVGVKMKNKEEMRMKEILNDEYLKLIMQERESMRQDAKDNILKLQQENCR